MERKKRRTGKLFALPVLLGFLVFYLYPFLVILGKSFTLGAGGRFFVGMENYKELWDNSLFRLAAFIPYFGTGSVSGGPWREDAPSLFCIPHGGPGVCSSGHRTGVPVPGAAGYGASDPIIPLEERRV